MGGKNSIWPIEHDIEIKARRYYTKVLIRDKK